jgi:hypothetical protein
MDNRNLPVESRPQHVPLPPGSQSSQIPRSREEKEEGAGTGAEASRASAALTTQQERWQKRPTLQHGRRTHPPSKLGKGLQRPSQAASRLADLPWRGQPRVRAPQELRVALGKEQVA